MVKMKKHPTLGIMVRSDGLILRPAWNTNVAHFDEYWTKGGLNNQGYRRIRINNITYLVHRIIAETFLENPDNKPQIDHIDRDPSNNDVSNLRWVTASENCRNRHKRYLRPIGKRKCDMSLTDYNVMCSKESKVKSQKEK